MEMTHLKTMLHPELVIGSISKAGHLDTVVANPAAESGSKSAIVQAEMERLARYQRAKRVFDLVVTTLGAIALSPLFLLVAALIKLHDRGPIFYVQDRIGQNGRSFRFYKFRSMVVKADQVLAELKAQNQHGEDARTFKMKRDPRITPIGRIIRRTSIDELPQLWNVLKGDMSLVGPRPPLPNEVELYSERDMRRLDVIPGLTCYWQISGRSELSFAQQVELDLRYIQDRTLTEDFWILLQTVPAVLFGKGAY